MIARASVGSEEEETEDIYMLAFVKDIIGNETYKHLLDAENSDGLRPLELAAHLGTFWIFTFLFETPDVYLTDIDHKLYRIQYFDITEYILGNRGDKSPVKAMLHLEESKLSLRSTQMVLQNDPMKCWFGAILYANIPVLILWFMFRLLLVGLMIIVDTDGFYTYVCPYGSFNTSISCVHVTSFHEYLPGYWLPTYGTVSVVVIMILLDDIINFIRYIFCRPRWLCRNVHGKKVTCVRYKFYRLTHSFCVFVYALHVILREFTNSYFGLMEFTVAFGFVWSFLFFLQLIPFCGHYIVASQRMINIFLEFSLLFTIFYLSYAFTLYRTVTYAYGADFANLRLALYNTFLIMQNMFSFKENPKMASYFTVHLLHITFTLVVPILLLNFLIALLTSAYTYISENRDVLMTIQRLSVAMAAEEKFTWCLAPLRNCLRRKYLVYEGGRVYATRTVWPSRNRVRCETPNWCLYVYAISHDLCTRLCCVVLVVFTLWNSVTPFTGMDKL